MFVSDDTTDQNRDLELNISLLYA